ncbi:MAG TPA: serine/threonine-protein kinase [Candidatus Solibacter sp.]|nr:serine/threonine-protein kinase [Candidatus Solibacter sp.]
MQKLGKYEILAELGHGAMGIVYKARDPFIGRLVALKTINSNLVDRPDLLERFYQEAQSAGKLQHPHIVTVFELGQEKDTPFIAMEYVDGESLEKIIIEQIDLPVALKVGYVVRVCQALEFAHKNRVVHRDIKPGNIMVNAEGVVKVVDFGIARLVDLSRTHTNMMIGTPAYMAPELFRKKKADERTDIWAVGITFYELLCYQRPFTGDGYDIIRSISEDEFPVASSIASECTPELDAIIGRMLRKSSTDRYQSMEDVLLELEPVWNRMRTEAASVLAERARGMYERGNLPRAQDALRRARLIDSSNVMAKSLLEKVSAELRRTETQPEVQEPRAPEIEKWPAPAGASSSPSSPPPRSTPSAPARTVLESATSLAGGSALQKPSVPVMTPPPSPAPAPPAIQTQIRVEERMPQISAAQPANSGSRTLTIFLFVFLGLAVTGGGIYAALRFLPKYLTNTSPEDLALKAEAQQLWDNHKLDDSLADWKKLASHTGPLRDEAAKWASDLEQQHLAVEQRYAEGMKLLYEEKKYPEAAVKFNEVIQMNSWKQDEARHEFEIASKGPGEAPPQPLWQALFEEGKQAFDKKDYAAAKQDFLQVTHTNGVSKDYDAQAEGLLVVIRDREEQRKNFDQAVHLEKAGQKQQAKGMFTRVVRNPNGDLDLVASAKNEIDQIVAIPEPPPDYSAAIGEVRNLISQGRWDDASAKLNGVPATQPNYRELKQQLDDGRKEDQYYSQMKVAFNGARTTKNKDALLTLKAYFMVEAGRGDRHSSDARDVVTQLDAEVSAIDAGKRPVSSAGGKVSDAAAIKDILSRYAAAYDAGDMQALIAVRQFETKDQSRLQDLLGSLKGKGYVLQNCTSPQIGRLTATVTCTGIFTKDNSIKPQRVNFVMKRVDKQWMIVASN